MMEGLLEELLSATQSAMLRTWRELDIEETGTVLEVENGIARVAGLHGASSEELLEFPGGLPGIVTDLGEQHMGVLLLGRFDSLKAGDEVRRTGRQNDVPVGRELLGRVINASGAVLDDGPPLRATKRRLVECTAPAILDRAPVTVPLQTGLKIVDTLIPVGRGQRELIIGDRQTGKTSVAVNAILNQLESDVLCIYCAIGQRATAVARVVETLREHGALDNSLVMVAFGDDPPGLQFITPYAAVAVAEYFVEQGRDVLVVFDDLTRHARAYRELSLLLRRPPGREAYPGDIFYIHARLLERAAHLRSEKGGGSLTALPVVETQAQDISAFIPTNLISITDGQIYLSTDLFRKGILPAIDIGLSVSRVGSKAQIPAYRKVAGDLRLSYTQFEELEEFARFGTRLDASTRAVIDRGRRVREILRQDEFTTLHAALQIAVLYALTSGLMDSLEPAQLRSIEAELSDRLQARFEKGELQRFAQADMPQEKDWQWLRDMLAGELRSIVAARGEAQDRE